MPELYKKLRDAHKNEQHVSVTTKDGSVYPDCIVRKAKNTSPFATEEAWFILEGRFGKRRVLESELEEVKVQD